MSEPEAVINLHFHTPCVLTTHEFEDIETECIAMWSADRDNPLMKLVAHVINDNRSRYLEAKQENS